jgi:cell division protein FtsB
MANRPGVPPRSRASRGPRVETRAVRLPREESAGEGWLRGIRFSGFTVLMLGLLVLAIIVLAPNLRIFIEQQNQLAELEASVAEHQEAVDELTEDVARWDDPAYIEAEARERLYFIHPGESSYIVIDDGATAADPAAVPITDQILTTQVDWMRAVLSSVYTAGLTVAPPDELNTPTGSGPAAGPGG